MQPQTKPTLYESLEALSEGMTGEILNGQLYTQPRPSGVHATAGFMLGAELLGPFHKGNGGPGGWWIFIEPEVHFVHDNEVTVPDLAGWRRERMPMPPTTEHRFEVVPDWVCEILSPSTEGRDRQIKLPLYAYYGVQYAWLIDPIKHTLEAYRLEAGDWLEIGRFAGTDQVAVPPFEAVSIELEGLWLPTQPTSV
ncbi:Uma2 family endonuclease [Candidatus Thiosymbion oneisti]|uniref:Uma2 family endonuclease n=1 Tax=Candidatus Thiosymbion oneisti TaxID=589554 RepID=UPI000AC9CFD7|nr:Uma2 family endonuclease [Candidatus Thiosymbion oneisti]